LTKYDYIEKFALAQYFMGIGQTISIKEGVVGRKPLVECSERQLKQITQNLRRHYNANSEYFKERAEKNNLFYEEVP
jgi:hypothetical protein|tara:strand:- start:77 stop:307 length:231 start_codon:yes stop_codon:yes gene_type:complete